MTTTATLSDVKVNQDGSIDVTWTDGYGSSFIDMQSLQDEVNRRLEGAASSLQWLLLNYWISNPSSTPVSCILDTEDSSGNWVHKL